MELTYLVQFTRAPWRTIEDRGVSARNAVEATIIVNRQVGEPIIVETVNEMGEDSR